MFFTVEIVAVNFPAVPATRPLAFIEDRNCKI